MVEVLDKVEEHQYLEIHRERNDNFHHTRHIIPVLLSLILREIQTITGIRFAIFIELNKVSDFLNDCFENAAKSDNMKLARMMTVFASVANSSDKKSDSNPVKRIESLVSFRVFCVFLGFMRVFYS